MARFSALAVNSAFPHAINDNPPGATVDIVLTWRHGRLVVTPDAGVGADAIHAFMVALAGIVRGSLIFDLTQMFPSDELLVSVRNALQRSAELGCVVGLVDERRSARRRVGEVSGGCRFPIHASVESAIGAA